MVSSGACSQITPQMTVYAATKVLYLNFMYMYMSRQILSDTLSNLPIVTNVLEFSLRFLIKLEELISAKNQEPPIADCKIMLLFC